jgi:hypothetical protein
MSRCMHDHPVHCALASNPCSIHVNTLLQLHTGNDFTEGGFECMIQYVYSGLVSGVTVGLLDTDKAAVAL